MSTATENVAKPKGNAWYSQSAEEVLAQLASTTDGLSAQEATQRLAADGPNDLKEVKRISLLQIFRVQFKSLLIWILIAGLLEEAGAEEGTPLQRKLDAFGRILVWATLGIVALLFGLGLLRGTKILELFMTSVSLAVAAVPEGLPAIVTVALGCNNARLVQEEGTRRNK